MTRNTKGPSRPKSATVVPLRPLAEPNPASLDVILELVLRELGELRREVKALRQEGRARPGSKSVATLAAEGADLLYGVPAIAAHMRMTDRKVYHLVSKGALPSFKIGGKVCARRADLDAWLAELATGGQG